MEQAKTGDTVKVHYTGKLGNGTVFDSSVNKEPLEFKIGDQLVIPDFEEAVIGMQPGDSKTITIESDNAYGSYREDQVLEVGRDAVPEDLNPSVGQRLHMQRSDGSVIPVTITAIADDAITLDTNHPLAGQDLTFDIELMEIV